MIALASSVRETPCSSTVPPTWPEQFVIVQRRIPDDDSGNSTTTTFYDFVRQANLIWIAPDSNESAVLWDLELGSGHSYYFTPTAKSCMRIEMPVGVLKPNWLENSTSLGERTLFGKRACGWTKVDFIDYWADFLVLSHDEGSVRHCLLRTGRAGAEPKLLRSAELL